MDKQFVSEPMDFNYKEGNAAVDFTKTFDLTGNDNDQMLKFYLRKAGLSDNIEYLTSEQRRAFIYDIVKSNKNPGYWKPSVLPQTSTARRDVFQKSPIERESSISLESIADIPPASMSFDFANYTKARSLNTDLNAAQPNFPVEQNENVKSTLYERQFSQPRSVSNKPNKTAQTPVATSTLVTRKGRKVDVSGPMNFQHISGDMTRDMTKNAFDLSGKFNNNSLKKYMIERGITEEDVSGMDSKDLIKKIVQSGYTWMPIRTQHIGNVIPPPPSETCMAAASSPPPSPRNISHSRGGAIIVSPPVLPADAGSSQENIYEEIVPIKRNTTSIRRHRKKPIVPPPPPPADVAAKKASPLEQLIQPQPLLNQTNSPPKFQLNASIPPPPPPPPPPPTIIGKTTIQPNQVPSSKSAKMIGTPISSQSSTSTLASGHVSSPPPPPVPPTPIPPPPPQVTSSVKGSESTQIPKPTATDSRDAFLESIRTGVTLKKVNPDKQLQKDKGINAESAPIQSHQQKTPPVSRREVTLAQPEKLDFMSELRNATLKRIKKLENNPFASESEC